ncbi:cytochrome C oxidase subunit IV family protein [Geoalkalibacter sp.]|uniref:cytochrome C oxidase subunit IV family protein n=1 Tax=Geoalkalibacter sp. TaxID=3041440 RepID=UPI00272E53F8|nr:cytochrome C oxidase subunit IV family protein [Geoalkalibacter sp.]
MTGKHKHIVSERTFIGVWLALLALTGVTVAVSHIDLGPWNVWLALSIASLKSALVIAFFMHMKYENRLFKGFFFCALLTLAIFIGFTFFDVHFR